MTHLESPSHEPHATIFSCVLSLPDKEQEFRKAITYTASNIAEEDMAKCAASPTEMGRENPCLLVATASVARLNWDQVAIVPEGPPLREMHSGTCRWWPPSQYLPGQSVMEMLL